MAISFSVLNSDEREKKNNRLSIERKKMLSSYILYLKRNNTEIYFYKPKYPENYLYYEKIRTYFIVNYILRNGFRKSMEFLGKDEIEKSPMGFLYLVENVINQRDYIRAKKMLAVARDKGYFIKKYYDLKKRLKEEPFRVPKIKKYKEQYNFNKNT